MSEKKMKKWSLKIEYPNSVGYSESINAETPRQAFNIYCTTYPRAREKGAKLVDWIEEK